MKRRNALKHIGAGLSAGLCLPWLSSCNEEEIGPEITYKGTIGIIGAGAAGLYAADYLLAKGINVIIFEASDRIGGRIRSLRPFDKTGPGLWFNQNAKISGEFPVELGSDRVYGSNSIWAKFIHQQKLQTLSIGDFTADKFLINGAVVNYQDAIANGDFESAVNFLQNIESQTDFNTSVQQRINSQGIASTMNFMLDGLIGNKFGTSNSRLNIGVVGESLSLRQRNSDVLLLANNPQADALIEGFIRASEKVELNSVVKSVSYEGDKVAITGEKFVDGASQAFNVEVDKVIVTVPISVLKAGDISFSPALPVEKTDAFSKIGMDAAIRVTLDFRKNFWGAGFRSLYGACNGPEYFNSGEGRSTVARTLSITVSGAKAEELSPLGTDIIPLLLEELDSAYDGMASEDIRLDAVEGKFIAAVQDWSKEPYIKGGMSYLKPGGTLTHREVLSKPVNQKVFFAGEATDFSGESGTVNGALISGERVAIEVISAISA